MSNTETLLVLDALATAKGLIDSLNLEDLTFVQQVTASVLRIDLENAHKIVLDSYTPLVHTGSVSEWMSRLQSDILYQTY